ncbi:TetR/AcrR family transcriptional regulator [Phenylobacterium sp.]|jgi:AcrR family transcriptional regulator|uniref:TetR/AcrR family transcriptional regulator n=1 Tax=Phenylobacterium sp. TaxID=1871053 RepID=UPI002E31F2BF|nr:TetR/AcrR family transcriptional regulator [Phenylobacterium sp.]HEX3363552.1 TetR/AcrR family transcriptional regulator [Phenylobacterium sp.]
MAAETQRKTGGKRERTRAALIAATLDVVAVKGFAGASLDAIAARAGMTRGAIYSNFAGRGELLLAAMGAKGLTLSPVYTPGAPLRVQLRAMADALVEALPRARGEAKFLAEFQLYALADPDLRNDLARGYATAFGQMADHLVQHHRAELALPPRQLAVILQSLAMGLVCQYLLTPEEVTENVIIAAVEAMADGVVRPAVAP